MKTKFNFTLLILTIAVVSLAIRQYHGLDKALDHVSTIVVTIAAIVDLLKNK